MEFYPLRSILLGGNNQSPPKPAPCKTGPQPSGEAGIRIKIEHAGGRQPCRCRWQKKAGLAFRSGRFPQRGKSRRAGSVRRSQLCCLRSRQKGGGRKTQGNALARSVFRAPQGGLCVNQCAHWRTPLWFARLSVPPRLLPCETYRGSPFVC